MVYEINLDKGYRLEWNITIKTPKNVEVYEVPYDETHPIIAQYYIDGDIYSLFGINISDKDIQTLKKGVYVDKNVSFEVWQNLEYTKFDFKKIDEFSGTFIDALEYIQKNFKL